MSPVLLQQCSSATRLELTRDHKLHTALRCLLWVCEVFGACTVRTGIPILTHQACRHSLFNGPHTRSTTPGLLQLQLTMGGSHTPDCKVSGPLQLRRHKYSKQLPNRRVEAQLLDQGADRSPEMSTQRSSAGETPGSPSRLKASAQQLRTPAILEQESRTPSLTDQNPTACRIQQRGSFMLSIFELVPKQHLRCHKAAAGAR